MGIEPTIAAWKAAILTITPRSHVSLIQYYNAVFSNNRDAVKTSTRISAIILKKMYNFNVFLWKHFLK